MSNIVDLYKEATYPVSKVTEGMLLVITNDTNEELPNGTIVKVIDLGTPCDHDPCADEDGERCCQRYLRLEAIDIKDDSDYLIETSACYCILHTMDGRRIVRDNEYVAKKRSIYGEPN